MAELSLFLVGFMGSGKSAVGESVAAAWGRPFVDTDERVVEYSGRSIERFFAESGEPAFRELERRVVGELLEGPPAVVATGGGAFAHSPSRRLLNVRGVTVWLDVPLGLVRARVGVGSGRPLWSTEDPLELRAFYERRRALYALARHRIDASPAVERVAAAVRAVCADSR